MSKKFNYEAWVEECYQKKLDQEIDNADRNHALFLFKRLLDKAVRDGEDVKIISHQLFADFYEKLIDRVQAVIDKGNKVDIIVETNVDSSNAFYTKFEKFITSAHLSFDELPNLIVVGDHAYRYETDKDSIKAVANFNDPEMGKFIKNLFTNIKAKLS